MHKTTFILLLSVFFFTSAFSQVTKIPEGYVLRGTIIDGDTVPSVKIKQIVILPPLNLTSRNDILKYRRLIRNVKKAYPYSQVAKDTFLVIEAALDSIADKRERKKYIKLKDKELQEKYTDDLKKLTISQGRILIKLIDRELDQTSYEIIKTLRGSFSAFLWQTVAKLFGEDLKTEFDAGVGEDQLIDRIVIMIENGQI